MLFGIGSMLALYTSFSAVIDEKVLNRASEYKWS